MTLPFGTRVTSCPNGKTTIHGVIVGCGSTGLDGIESYVVAWKHQALAARPTWHFSTELTVVPDDKPDVRSLANEAGLMCPDDKDGTDLMRWLFECLRGAYDHLESIDRLLPFQPGREYTERVQGLLNEATAARQEVNVARARAEETRRELEAVAMRIVPASELKVGDIIYGLLKPEMYKMGFPVMWKAPPLRVTKLHDEDEDLLVILGPDPTTLLEGL